jgi:hypothetical protein
MNRSALTAAALALSIAPALAWEDQRGPHDYHFNPGRRCQWEQVDVGTYTNSDNRNQPDRGPRFDRNWNRCR